MLTKRVDIHKCHKDCVNYSLMSCMLFNLPRLSVTPSKTRVGSRLTLSGRSYVRSERSCRLYIKHTRPTNDTRFLQSDVRLVRNLHCIFVLYMCILALALALADKNLDSRHKCGYYVVCILHVHTGQFHFSIMRASMESASTTINDFLL